MKIKLYSFSLSLFISLISILPINKINAEELPILDTSENYFVNYSQVEELTQHNHHDHNNHDDSNPELNNQEIIPEEWEHFTHGEDIFWLILVDQLEYRVNNQNNTFNWDAKGWIGGDYQRLWLKTEGDVDLESGDGEAETQLLYSKLIDPFWDLQMGVRYDQLYGDNTKGRGFAVIGLEGVAPHFIHIDTALFVSHQGDISLRFKGESDLLLSQKLVLQPSLETNLAIQQVEDFGVGSGFNDLELGLRLRYEVNRNFAPYLGINWKRLLGDTANFAQKEGESIDEVSGVVGLRLLF
jgi:copper resistance protein B